MRTLRRYLATEIIVATALVFAALLMLFSFFLTLREAGVKASLSEFLTLLEALSRHVAIFSLDDFYYLARTALVKDESQFDRFDRAFAAYFKGVESIPDALVTEIPAEWLRKLAERWLTDEEKQRIEALGGWEKLMETLRQRLEEQRARHQGGSKWVGTAGTSPFGAYGYNPEGVRIGQEGSRNRRAVKVWDRREYQDYDTDRELGVRNIKLALRRLRRFAREGAPEVLDLDGTIRHSHPPEVETFHRWAAELGVPVTPERARGAERWLHAYWAQSDELVDDDRAAGGDRTGVFWRRHARRHHDRPRVARRAPARREHDRAHHHRHHVGPAVRGRRRSRRGRSLPCVRRRGGRPAHGHSALRWRRCDLLRDRRRRGRVWPHPEQAARRRAAAGPGA